MSAVVQLTGGVAPLADVGGKAFYLNLLLSRCPVRVPTSWVLPACHFDKAVRLLAGMNAFRSPDPQSSVFITEPVTRDYLDECVSPLMKSAIPSAMFPLVARSSATDEDGKKRSMAGRYRSVLGLRNWRELLTGVDAVWSSCLARRRPVYCVGDESEASMAVLVQPLLSARASGVAFSVDPLFPECILIEATIGLGQPLVSGQIDPDRFQVDRSSLNIQERTLGEKASSLQLLTDGTLAVVRSHAQEFSLTDSAVQSVAELCVQCELALGFPVNVEWVLESTGLWVVQARPAAGIRICDIGAYV